jgi:hypothetical protein
MTEKEIYIKAVENGIELRFGLLVINEINRTGAKHKEYQVFSDYSHDICNVIFKDLSKGVERFISIKNRVRK